MSLDGGSALPVLAGDPADASRAGETIAVLSEDDRYLYLDGWKIVWDEGRGSWSLFYITRDRGETTDLADERPEKLAELVAAWEADEARGAAAALK